MTPTATAADVSLETFLAQVRGENPFLVNRVNGPDDADCDAVAVHQAAFTRLTDLAAEALRARHGLGAVVWGEAGIGKSHLLARLGRWAAADDRAVFVYLHNLQAAPEHLPRTLLRHVVAELTQGRRRDFHLTPLFDAMHAAVAEAVGSTARPPSWDFARRRFDERAAGFDRSIYDVLFQFFRSAYRAIRRHEDDGRAETAARWLAGQALDAREAYTLGLPLARLRDEPVALEDAQQIKQVLVALARVLASRKRPLVLAFDQVDNLDDDQFAALSRFLEALLDGAPNLLVVTAGVQASLMRWREGGVIQASAWDRVGQFEIALQRLDVGQARQLILVRLDAFLTPFAGLEAVQRRRREDALFPLGKEWFERQFRDYKDVRPRDVASWAREGWRERQEEIRRLGVEWIVRQPPPLPAPVPPRPWPELVDRFLDERLAELTARPPTQQNLPSDAEHIAGLLYAALQQCRTDPALGVARLERVPLVKGRPPTHLLTVVQQTGADAAPLKTGVLVLTGTNRATVTAALRRPAQEPPAVTRFVLVTEERTGLPLGAKGKSYLDKLDHRYAPHFHQAQVTVTDYAMLQALQTVVREARSGDLEIPVRPGEVRQVSEADVTESHHRRGRYRALRLLAELLAPQPAPVGVASPGVQ
jgi:hypothetical protein